MESTGTFPHVLAVHSLHAVSDQSEAVFFSSNVLLKIVVCASTVFFRSLGVTFFSIVGFDVKYICDEACRKPPEETLYSDSHSLVGMSTYVIVSVT